MLSILFAANISVVPSVSRQLVIVASVVTGSMAKETGEAEERCLSKSAHKFFVTMKKLCFVRSRSTSVRCIQFISMIQSQIQLDFENIR